MVATIKSLTSRFIQEEDGATMVEYVLLVALIGVIAIGAMKFLGSSAGNKMNTVSSNITTSS
jgi:pilus assembly protein Flp/PilA